MMARIEPWRLRASALLYSGSSRECPVCSRTFRRFLPDGLDLPLFREKRIVGGGLDADALCPGCRAVNRERLLALYLRTKTRLLTEHAPVLHMGPEPGIARLLKSNPNIRYVSADLNLRSASARADITALGFRDASFDAIVCCHVLEHVPADRQATRELLRVLKPGGWTILQVPVAVDEAATYEDWNITSPEEREQRFGQRDHVRLYGRDYKDRLEAVGFTVHLYNFTREHGSSAAHRYGVLPDEDIYVCWREDPTSAP